MLSSDPVRSRPSVLVPMRDRLSFLRHYFNQEGHAGLFVPGNLHYAPGESVDLEITFLKEQRSFRIRGMVRWSRAPTRPQDPAAGIGVFFGPSEQSTRDLIMDFVQGKDIRFRPRADHRFPVALQIEYRTGAAVVTECTDDVSVGGAFIVTRRDIAEGSVLPIRLKLPGWILPLKLRGVVCWRRTTEPTGVGVKFIFDSERQRRKLERLVARMKAQIIRQMQDRALNGSSAPPPAEAPPADAAPAV